MNSFIIYKTEQGYDIELSNNFKFYDLTPDTAGELIEFLLSMGYEEYWGVNF